MIRRFSQKKLMLTVYFSDYPLKCLNWNRLNYAPFIGDGEFLAGVHFERAAVGQDEFEDERAVAGIFFNGGEEGFQGGFVEAFAGEAEADGFYGGFRFEGGDGSGGGTNGFVLARDAGVDRDGFSGD